MSKIVLRIKDLWSYDKKFQIRNYNLGHILVDICEKWQKVLVCELAKSTYFRSASLESDNK